MNRSHHAEVDGEIADGEIVRKPWTNRGEMKRMFEAVRERIGETVYLTELGRFNVRKADDFRNESAAWSCYKRLVDSTKEVA